MNFSFKVKDSDEIINVFTTRPDTIMGVSFIAISASHKLSIDLSEKDDKFKSFIEKQKKVKQSEAEFAKQEKEGLFTELYAIHPFTCEGMYGIKLSKKTFFFLLSKLCFRLFYFFLFFDE